MSKPTIDLSAGLGKARRKKELDAKIDEVFFSPLRRACPGACFSIIRDWTAITIGCMYGGRSANRRVDGLEELAAARHDANALAEVYYRIAVDLYKQLVSEARMRPFRIATRALSGKEPRQRLVRHQPRP